MKALLWVRVLNQVGAFALAFLAVVAGPHLVTAALTVFGVAALASRWAGGVLLDRLRPPVLVVAGLTATGLALLALAAARRPLSGRPRAMLLLTCALALAMALARDVPLTVVAYLAWAMAGSALLGHWPALAPDAAPPADRPRWFAFLDLSWGVAQPAVPGIVGLVAAVSGRTAAAPLAATMAFLVAVGAGAAR